MDFQVACGANEGAFGEGKVVVSVEKDVILVTSFLFPWERILSYGNTLLVFYVRFTLLFFGFVLNPYQMYT